MHRCHIFEMNGESYRFRESMKAKKGRKTESVRAVWRTSSAKTPGCQGMLQGGTGHDGNGALLCESLENGVEDHGAASVGSRYLPVWRHVSRHACPPSKPWVRQYKCVVCKREFYCDKSKLTCGPKCEKRYRQRARRIIAAGPAELLGEKFMARDNARQELPVRSPGLWWGPDQRP